MSESPSRSRSQPASQPATDRFARPDARTASIARRERLREFQSSLSERMRRAQTVPVASSRLGLQIGPSRVLVDLAEAAEILAVPAITPVPLVKAWYRGLCNVRGNLLGVIDLSLFAGGPATPLDQDSRVLAFGADLQFASGILVSRMLGLRSASDLGPAPDSDPAAPASLYAPWVRSRLVDAQGVLWDELDLATLATDERFLWIGRT